MLLAVRQVRERIERLQQTMRDAVPDGSLASVVEALRGMDMVGAIVFQPNSRSIGSAIGTKKWDERCIRQPIV